MPRFFETLFRTIWYRMCLCISTSPYRFELFRYRYSQHLHVFYCGIIYSAFLNCATGKFYAATCSDGASLKSQCENCRAVNITLRGWTPIDDQKSRKSTNFSILQLQHRIAELERENQKLSNLPNQVQQLLQVIENKDVNWQQSLPCELLQATLDVITKPGSTQFLHSHHTIIIFLCRWVASYSVERLSEGV